VLEKAVEKPEQHDLAQILLWQASYVSHMALEVHDYATKDDWSLRFYREYLMLRRAPEWQQDKEKKPGKPWHLRCVCLTTS
jgi:hypothetical protein